MHFRHFCYYDCISTELKSFLCKWRYWDITISIKFKIVLLNNHNDNQDNFKAIIIFVFLIAQGCIVAVDAYI